MSEEMTTTYRGYELIYYPKHDLWGPCRHDLPIVMGTMQEVREAIDRWEIDKQMEAGFRVWNLSYDNPKYWEKRDAVFRLKKERGVFTSNPSHHVRTRNFVGNPDSFYDLPRRDVAMDTPEVAAAIVEAKVAYAEAVEAGNRWKEARDRIPRMTVEEWEALPEREKDG